MTKSSSLRIGYLISKYPAVSHTFILREIAAIRQRAITIEVASINEAGDRNTLTQAERDEADSTFYVKRAGAVGALRSLATLGLRHPGRLFAGVGLAFKLGHMAPRRTLLCLFYLAEAAILAQWMKERSLTHLHVHFATQAATVALILKTIAPIDFSMMVHGPDEFYDVDSYFLEEKVVKARFAVCISYFAQSQMMKLSPGTAWEKFDIARLGVDCSHFVPRPFRTSPEAFEVLCVGRLVSTKGQRILIEAAEQLVRQGRSFQLRFVGDGPDRSELEHLVSGKGLAAQIRFEGPINQDRILAFYRQADIFALASFAEGIPVVLMEAMAMEIPCIATAINGIPELIRDGVDGLLVAPSDVDGLAAALARLMDEHGLRESLGKAGRQRVLESYEISASADRLRDVFEKRLGAH
ncbi:MAG: glycosyltransferase family 4 protein [Acidobacteria bacterium]|nr:glycosyltransferase family 4 protein [Acidobacteriota bacterium]